VSSTPGSIGELLHRLTVSSETFCTAAARKHGTETTPTCPGATGVQKSSIDISRESPAIIGGQNIAPEDMAVFLISAMYTERIGVDPEVRPNVRQVIFPVIIHGAKDSLLIFQPWVQADFQLSYDLPILLCQCALQLAVGGACRKSSASFLMRAR
jgi:hypothetical protein